MRIHTYAGDITITDADVLTSPIAPALADAPDAEHTRVIQLGDGRRLFITADEADHIRLERESLEEIAKTGPRFVSLDEAHRTDRARFAYVALLATEGNVGRAAAVLREAGVISAPTDAAARRALDRLITEQGWREWLSTTYAQPGRARPSDQPG